MPAKKPTKAKQENAFEKPSPDKKRRIPVNFKAITVTLAFVFFVIWILVGAFVLVVIVQSVRQGAFAGLFSSPGSASAASGSQAASQTIIPGVGLVDVACVKQALPEDSIQKLVTSGDTSALTDDEKTKLEPCILQKEAASPSPSESPSK